MGRDCLACGIMSGTSRDGVDVAIVEIEGRFPNNRIRVIHAETKDYPGWLARKLMAPAGRFGCDHIASLDFFLGKLFAERALRALRHAGLKPNDIDVIGSHGQTLVHLPRGMRVGKHRVRSTLQVGSGAVIAQTTGITTVSDFRSSDIAVGGEGAPLVPVFDYVFLRSPEKSRVALNIGGIANLTAIPKRAKLRDIVSFDTGPGNCVIDTAVGLLTGGRMRYDKDGALAESALPDGEELQTILGHRYFKRRPPKSTGWEEFGQDFTRAAVDRMRADRRSKSTIVSTITEVVTQSIAQSIYDFVIPMMTVDEIIVTGGGSHNPVIMDGLRITLPGVRVETGEAFGLSSDAKEASAFGYLAYLALKGIPANVISQNHGLKPAILGAIYKA